MARRVARAVRGRHAHHRNHELQRRDADADRGSRRQADPDELRDAHRRTADAHRGRHDRLRDRRRGSGRVDQAVEGGVSSAARRGLPHVRVRMPRGQLGHSQLHRDVAIRAARASQTMTKPDDPKRPGGGDPALSRLELALKAAENLIEDQKRRLQSLGVGREESMRALADVREELKRVSRERDELRKQLSRLDRMQTEAIALPEDFRLPGPLAVPSLDELMSALGDIESPKGGPTPVAGHLHQRVESQAEGSGEMLSPEIVFPEKYAATAESAKHQAP